MGRRTVSWALNIPRAVLLKSQSPPQPSPGTTTDLFSITVIFSALECYVNGIIRYNLVKLASLSSIMHLGFIQVFMCVNSFFLLLLNSIPLYRCITVCLSFHSVKDIWVGSGFWQFWIELLCEHMLCEHMFSVL